MKSLIAPLAALLVLGATTVVNAAPILNEANPARGAAMQGFVDTDYVPYHKCHGISSGMGSAACGTATGGPVGGLF